MSDFVKATQVFLDNPAASRDDVIDFLAKKGVELGIAEDEAALAAAFQAREAEGSTGMTGGFAIPHAKSATVKEPAVLVVKTAEPVEDWETMDKKPVEASIALLIPESEVGTGHLRLLSKVAVMLMKPEFVEQVLTATDEQAIADAINAGLDD